MILVILLGGALSALGMAFTIDHYELKREHQYLEHRNTAHARNFTNMVARDIEEIRSLAAFIGAVGYVNRTLFRNFAEPIIRNNPGLKALEWVPRIRRDDRSIMEETAKADGVEDFRFKDRAGSDFVTAPVRNEYFPVYFAEPEDRNGAELGFDMGTNPAYREALDKARDSGKLVATTRISLSTGPKQEYGVLMIAPVYETSTVPETVSQRRADLVGFAVGVFPFINMLTPTDEADMGDATEPYGDDSAEDAGEEVEIFLLDMSADTEERLLYPFVHEAWQQTKIEELQAEAAKSNFFTVDYAVADRSWRLIYKPVRSKNCALSQPMPWIVLTAGFALTSLLAAFLWHVANRTRTIERVVAERSAELTAMNDKLQDEIDQRIEVEKQLVHTQKMEAIGELTGGIAHDFNNLLMVISGYAQRALSALYDQESAEQSLKEVVTASQKAANLTRQLLGFSRREAMNQQVMRLPTTIRDMKGLLSASTGEHCELEFDLSDDDICVETDPTELSQAVLNLVVNARDAMPKGGTITVGVTITVPDEAFMKEHPNLEPGRYACVYVRDEGVGMDEETMNNVFVPFFTTKDQGRGTGLGLSMVYGFSQRSKGTVTIGSAPGAGTTVVVYLPIVDKKPIVETLEVSEDYSGKGETILLVEDDSQLLQLTRETLEHLGYTVLIASDGVEALEVEQDHDGDIDLLLTDAVMPNLGGFELAEMLKQTRPDLRIVVMSGYTKKRAGDVADILEQITFVHKPVSMPDLAKLVRTEIDTTAPIEQNATIH